MIIASIFWLASIIAVIRLWAFARFTARHGNIPGAAFSYTLVFIILVCSVFATFRL